MEFQNKKFTSSSSCISIKKNYLFYKKKKIHWKILFKKPPKLKKHNLAIKEN